ncbi:DNA mismatch repair protein MutS [Dyadobacter subterraneus]|uniref:DNA mismatch repair protein MutS n=1 Tax=Dyadobacter subterraneus TaxID=2773304 RepID=A0ABR9WDW7_9BACT|nr:DNA mismatch repair protein MutS [Dyadobacter subterraneus]MBE9463622.1 DNA mismatch repair protein MutS [Dyadobacter subterraneus]
MFISKKKLLARLKNNSIKIKEESFDFDRIARFFTLSDTTNFRQVISDRTFQDLDMDEIFMFLDRTTSKVGQQLLYLIIRTIPENDIRTEKFEKIIQGLKENPEVREKILREISVLNQKNAYNIPSLFLENHIGKPGWFWVIQVLSLTSVFSLLLSFLFPKIFLFLILLLAVNFSIHYWNKLNVYKYSSSIPQLLLLNQAAKKIVTFKGMADQHPGIFDSVKAIDSLGMQMSLFKLEIKLQSEIGQAVEYLAELVKAFFLIEPLVLYNVLKVLDLKRKEVQNVYEYVGEIDAAISINFLRDDLPYFCLPTIISAKKQITAVDVYHPLIYQFVPNSINLNERSALLTGSNMSGKTTFIRTVGINTITAQTINTCFAREFVIPKLKIHSAIRISDDLLNDKSYYFEEVLTIKALLEESNLDTRNLFLLDEIFKGTNTVERIASGKAVLTYLNRGNNMAVAATHDLELAELLKDEFSMFHFAEVILDGEIKFDYKIKPGNLTNTNAIRILELNNYPKEVTDEATLLANRIYHHKTGSTTGFDSKL